jgi:hypothetical protein
VTAISRREYDAHTEQMAAFVPRTLAGVYVTAVRTKDGTGKRRHQYLCTCANCNSATWRRVSEVTAAAKAGTVLRCGRCFDRASSGSSGKFCGLCFGLPHRVFGRQCAQCGTAHSEDES